MFATSRARNCENEEDANCRAISRARAVARARDARLRAVARGFATLPKTRARKRTRARANASAGTRSRAPCFYARRLRAGNARFAAPARAFCALDEAMVARKHARAVGRASGARDKLAWGPWTARRLFRFDGAELAAKARARIVLGATRRARNNRASGWNRRAALRAHDSSRFRRTHMVPPDPWFRMEHAGSSVYLGTPTGPARLTAAEQARQVVAGPDKL